MSKRLDGGYAWAIVFSTFITTAFVFGTEKTSGVLFVYFRAEYNATNTATATVSLSQRITTTSTALVFSFLAERFGSRVVMMAGSSLLVIGTVSAAFVTNLFEMILTLGITMGLGMSMLIYPAMQMLPKYFNKNLAIASAIMLIGGSVGQLFLPLLITFAIEEYGFSGSFFILGAVYLHAFIAALLMWPSDHWKLDESKENADGEKEAATVNDNTRSCMSTFKVYWEILKNKSLLLYYFAHMTNILSCFCFLTYQQAHVEDRGITDHHLQAWLTSIWGITEIVSRVIFGFVLHFDVIQSYRLLQISAFSMAVILVVYPWLYSYWMIAAASSALAFFFSAGIVSMVPTIRLVIGIDRCSPAVGLICLPVLIAYLTVQLGGVIRDVTGTFVIIYYMCSVLLIIATFALEILAYRLKSSICQTGCASTIRNPTDPPSSL